MSEKASYVQKFNEAFENVYFLNLKQVIFYQRKKYHKKFCRWRLKYFEDSVFFGMPNLFGEDGSRRNSFPACMGH